MNDNVLAVYDISEKEKIVVATNLLHRLVANPSLCPFLFLLDPHQSHLYRLDLDHVPSHRALLSDVHDHQPAARSHAGQRQEEQS